MIATAPPARTEPHQDAPLPPRPPAANAMPQPLVRMEQIRKTYRLGESEVPVLMDVSLTIGRGEMVTLMGASGSGKTTLMNILGCLDRPSSGQFWLDGQEMSEQPADVRALVRMTQLGFVFQNFSLLPRTSALQNVLMPCHYAVPRPPRSAALALAKSLLEQVGLADRMHHEPAQMSGGQQQRVAIARALMNRPSLLLADEPTGNLDSRAGAEILQMFQQLHGEGITVILVTHDPKVADYADRTIHMTDGRIEEDRHQRTTAGTRIQLERLTLRQQPIAEEARPATPATRWAVMTTRMAPAFRMAWDNLRRHKMRSSLTVLGIIIGVAAVIAMREIGQGSKLAIEKTITSMGAHKIPIFPAAVSTGGVSQGAGSFQTLKPEDVDEIARQCPAVTVAAPLVWSQAQAVYGTHNWFPQRLTGTTPCYLATRDWDQLAAGTCFTDDDVRLRNSVCLLGATVCNELFENESPIGKTIRIRNVPFEVVGLLDRRGTDMMGNDQDDCIIAPWTTVKLRLNGLGTGATKATNAAASASNSTHNPYPAATRIYPQVSPAHLVNRPPPASPVNIDIIQAKAATTELMPIAIQQITALLRERHHLADDDEDDFKILDMTEIARASSRSSELMSTLLLVVAAISLAVGGVGIMNIMLVSVTERTREIGLRMAVGARQHQILQQFLLEAFLLCLAGGAVGILLGRGTSILVREIQHWSTEISVPMIVISVLIAGSVGLIFGFYPAWKASRLDPIEALRHE